LPICGKYAFVVISGFGYLQKHEIMIKLQVIGNLGKDAQVNNVNGKNVINFTVAHTERFRDAQGNQKDKTTWVDCAYWTDRTAVAPYLKKGTQVYVEGQPDVRTYTTQDGRNGASLTLRVLSVQLLGSKGEGGNDGGGNGYQQQAPAYSQAPAANSSSPADLTEPMDDLPF
jgi:single-strand DNA-binding protein